MRSASQYGAVVAGAGPAGLAVVGNLLENNISGKIAWIDPEFAAGKLGKQWREVPSNTKVNLFIAYAEALEPFRHVIDKFPTPNAITALQNLPQDKGCQISYAADMTEMLTRGISTHPRVEPTQGTVTGANWDDELSSWTVQVQPPKSDKLATLQSDRIILATGASPTCSPIPIPDLEITKLCLDVALTPSILSTAIPKDKPTNIAVIGGSHSGVLVLMNLFKLASTTHPDLRVTWFTRSGLLYAEFKDGWILYDNTGLKGQAAVFAKEQLEDDKLPTSPAGKVIKKVDTGIKAKERKQYQRYLPQCSHVIHAVGFTPNPAPMLTKNGVPLKNIFYDHLNGGFKDEKGEKIKGLCGAGIAYPERVTDPVGNVEYSVGLWKFMKYLKRVTPYWLGKGVNGTL